MATLAKTLAESGATRETLAALEEARREAEAAAAAKTEEATRALAAARETQPAKRSGAEIDPRFLYKVIRQQFNVMHHWLKPMYETTQKGDKTIDELNAAVNNLMQTHGSLLNYLQQFQNRKKP